MTTPLYEVWRYRRFIVSSILNDLRVSFARSKIGVAWMILHPLLQVLMYALVLSAVLSAKIGGIDNRFSYAIYLTAGILGWNLMQEIISRCLGIFISNGNLIKKIAFPVLSLPLIVTGSALLNNLVLLGAIVVIFGILGHLPGLSIVWLPVIAAATMSFALGFGLILGVLNVFMRDIGQIMPVILQFIFWFTPVVYPISVIPEKFQSLLRFSPFFQIIDAYHQVIVYGQQPNIVGLFGVMVMGAAMLCIAAVLYRRASPEMVDML